MSKSKKTQLPEQRRAEVSKERVAEMLRAKKVEKERKKLKKEPEGESGERESILS